MAQQQEITLPAVLSERLLIVPDYQRPYAWESKQLNDLWEDLDLLGPHGTHYAGTLVLRDLTVAQGPKTSMDDEGTTLRHAEVVDGQQRLTTCLILLDRVRRSLQTLAAAGAEAANQVAQSIRRKYGMTTVDNVAVPRLRLGTDLNSYWVDTILGDHAFAGHQILTGEARLRAAAAFFEGKLAVLTDGCDADEAFARLKEVQRRVTAGLRFLVYEVTTAAEVGVIFETLNERGRPLSDLEKTKNYLLYLARQIPDARSEELAAFINDRWSSMFGNLVGEVAGADDQLLRWHWLATRDPDARNWAGVASIKRRFDRSKYVPGATRLAPPAEEAPDEGSWDRLFDDVTAYVRTLHDCSLFLRETLELDAEFVSFHSGVDDVRRRIAALRRSGVTALYQPLLLASRLARPTDGEFFAELVDLCERYSARVFVIAQRRANAGQARLFRLAHDLFTGTDRYEVLASMRAVLWRYAPDERLRANLLSLDENWYIRRGHKYFLYEYELHLMDPGEELMPLAAFTDKAKQQRTTEHILPQHPDDGANCWWDVFTLEQHVALRHALGNLALTLDNSKYSNHCFEVKRGKPMTPGESQAVCYAQGKLHQERELAAFEQWTPATIEKRQADLAEWAMERWSVAAPSTVDVEVDDVEPEIELEGDPDSEAVLDAT